jgi:hypothetical protein
MFTTLRKFTVIFLALLQLIAPLVHAHSGEKSPDLGLHVPGLEMYAIKHDVLMNHDFSSGRFSSRPIAMFPPSLAVEGIMVGVDTGMKDKKMNPVTTSDQSHHPYQLSPIFKAALASFDINFPPQTAQVISRLFIPSLSPRAPPAP